MTVVANFTIPHTDFVLGRILEVREGINVRLESMIPTGEAVMPYFWVSRDDADAVETALRGEPLTESVEVVDELNDETLFRVEWDEDIDGLVASLLAFDAVLLEAEGTGDTWSIELRFPDYDTLSAFYRDCVRKDISLDLDKVHNAVEAGGHGQYGLTHEQRQTILTALDAGYFDVPRETTLVELSEELGISDSAVSQRLRRGLTQLVSATLLPDH